MHFSFRRVCALAVRSLSLAGVLSAMLFSSAAMGSTYSLTLGEQYQLGWYLQATITTTPALSYQADLITGGSVLAEHTFSFGLQPNIDVYNFTLIPGGPSPINPNKIAENSSPKPRDRVYFNPYAPTWGVQYDNLLFPAENAGPGVDPNGSGVAGDSFLDAYGIMSGGIFDYNQGIIPDVQYYYLSLVGSTTTPGGYGMTLYSTTGDVVDSQIYAPATGVGSGDAPMTLTIIPEIDPGSFASTVALLLGLMGVLERRCRPMPLLARGPLSRPHS